jgi:hypothetical protein
MKAAKTAGPKRVGVKAAATKSPAMEAAATEAAATEAAAVTAPAPTAMTTAASTAPASTAPRQRRGWLGECQNACERDNGNSQAACNADRLHADLLLTIAARLAAGEWSSWAGRWRPSSPQDEIRFNRRRGLARGPWSATASEGYAPE